MGLRSTTSRSFCCCPKSLHNPPLRGVVPTNARRQVFGVTYLIQIHNPPYGGLCEKPAVARPVGCISVQGACLPGCPQHFTLPYG